MTRRRFQPLTSAVMQAALRRIAERHGYIATRGPHAGRGNPSELVQALDAGELATVLLDSDARWRVIAELERHAATLEDTDYDLSLAIRSAADQLRAAAEREYQLEVEELADYLDESARPL